mgnify:CR=1 FL=1
MELSRTQKILLAVGSIWPLIYIFVFILFIVGMIAFSGAGGGRELDPMFSGGFLLIFVIHFFTILLSLALTIFYIIHAVKNTRLDPNMRIVWIVLFFFGGIIAEPIYWYLEIWREKPNKATNVQLPPQPASVDNFQDIRSDAYVPPNEPPDWR